MRVWVVEYEPSYEPGGVEGVYADPIAAATDLALPLDEWKSGKNDNYRHSGRDLCLYPMDVLDVDGVLAKKKRDAEEEAHRRAEERARRWIK